MEQINGKAVYEYQGQSLGTNNLLSYEYIWDVASGQDGVIWNDLLFRFNGRGNCSVYSMSEHNKVGSFTLDKTSVIVPHSNAVCFGTEKFDEADEYPLLYTNIYNNYSGEENRLEGVCCVYRLTKNDSGFETSLVQVIKIGFADDTGLWISPDVKDVRPYGNFVVDTDKNELIAFTMLDGIKATRYFTFRLPKLSDGEYCETYCCNAVALKADDIRTQFDCEYSRYLQGACYYKGKIYSVEGFSDSNNAPKMQVIDLAAMKQYASIDLWDIGLKIEPEFVDFHDDILYYLDASGKVRTFTFY